MSKENGRVFAGFLTIVTPNADMSPIGTKAFKDVEELGVENFLQTYEGLRVVEGVEADGSDDEWGAVMPGEFIFERVRSCVTDVVRIEADIELLGSGRSDVVWHFVCLTRSVVSCSLEEGKEGRKWRAAKLWVCPF